MDNRFRTRTWAYTLIAGIALALAVALAACAASGHSSAGPATNARIFPTAMPDPQVRTVDAGVCARVLTQRVAANSGVAKRSPRSTSDARRRTERACIHALAENFEPGFFLPPTPTHTAAESSQTAP